VRGIFQAERLDAHSFIDPKETQQLIEAWRPI
jgi:hypothetical protein